MENPTWARQWMLVVLGLTTILITEGCFDTVYGQRATSGCPDGGVCSNKTPDGLVFRSTAQACGSSHEELPCTAVGGYQTFEVAMPPWSFGALPNFSAQISNRVFTVVDTDSSHVTVRALVAGHADLRIVDPVTGELFDQVPIQAAAPRPITPEEVFPTDWQNGGVGGQDDARPIALFRQATSTLRLCFRSEEDKPIVDERAAIRSVSHQPAVIERVTWNLVRIQPPSQSDVQVQVQLGDFPLDLALPVADQVDALVLSDMLGFTREEGKCVRQRPVYVLATPLSGERLVVSVPLEWSFTGPAEPHPEPQYLTEEPSKNVFEVMTLDLPGILTVTATANGEPWHWSCELVEQDQATRLDRRTQPPLKGRTKVLGERARAVLSH